MPATPSAEAPSPGVPAYRRGGPASYAMLVVTAAITLAVGVAAWQRGHAPPASAPARDVVVTAAAHGR